ncbi:MAG: sensor domain-containing diguanylate cyclase [Gammaproteobacteria bacterium]
MQDIEHIDSHASSLDGSGTRRLRHFHSNILLNTTLEERLERIVRVAGAALGVPVTAVTVVDDDRQWFKALCGWDAFETAVAESLCSRTVRSGETVIIRDLAEDNEFNGHPWVIGEPGFRFYAGVPLQSDPSFVRGTLCVMDTVPRELDAHQRQVLSDLATLAERELLTVALHDAHRELLAKLTTSRRNALIDPLTRVWNRRGGLVLLERTLGTGAAAEGFAVCMIDIDEFKQVNDHHGHRAGDRALRVLAKTLVSCLRSDDVVCRLGGDEFLVVMQGVDRETAEAVLERIRARLRETTVRTTGNALLRLSVSVGIGIFDPEAGGTLTDALEAADRDLYRAKRAAETDRGRPALSAGGRSDVT